MGAPAQKHSTFEATVTELLREPFAVDTSMNSMTFEAAGKILEEVADDFGTNAAEGQNQKLRTSYERCKELYVSLLMDVESHPEGIETISLGELIAPVKAKTPPAKRPKKATKPVPSEEKSDANHVTKTAVVEKQEETQLPSQTALSIPSNEKALEFWHAREVFWASGLPESLALRFEAQCLAFALEMECRSRLAPGVQAFWKKRLEAMSVVSDVKKGGQAKQELIDALHDLGAERPDWLEAGKLPEAALRGIIRYLALAPASEPYQPSLIELGLLLVFFGSDEPLRGCSRVNVFGDHDLSSEELIEVFFRLMRAQVIRNAALDSGQAIDAEHLEALKATAYRTLELVNRFVASATVTKEAS